MILLNSDDIKIVATIVKIRTLYLVCFMNVLVLVFSLGVVLSVKLLDKKQVERACFRTVEPLLSTSRGLGFEASYHVCLRTDTPVATLS